MKRWPELEVNTGVFSYNYTYMYILALSPLATPMQLFNVCTRKAEGPGIRSHVQYVTVQRVVEG